MGIKLITKNSLLLSISTSFKMIRFKLYLLYFVVQAVNIAHRSTIYKKAINKLHEKSHIILHTILMDGTQS